MCAVRVTLCVSGIVRAVHQSSSKLGDTPLVRLDLFESLPSRRFGCRASTTNSTTKSRSTSLYNGGSSSRSRCRALQLYSAPERSTALQLYSALHSLYILYTLPQGWQDIDCSARVVHYSENFRIPGAGGARSGRPPSGSGAAAPLPEEVRRPAAAGIAGYGAQRPARETASGE